MLETQFSLSWKQHMNNLSYGLSKFQQNGEFVDMTLAAEGSFVKAHQMILSLVSPYIKDIIASLNCSHPVIFLSNISYRTLCSILDYVYKGEVQVSKEQMDDLIKAGKVLQIKGLQEMSPQTSTHLQSHQTESISTNNSCEEKTTILQTKLDATSSEEHLEIVMKDQVKYESSNDQEFVIEDPNPVELEINEDVVDFPETPHSEFENTHDSFIIDQNNDDSPRPFFTISNQASLQLVLNRHLYFLKYKSMSASGHSQWKCVNYIDNKCPAYIITKNDSVIQQQTRHSHPYHDNKIAKKVASGEMFSSMRSAEEFAKTKKAANAKRIRGNKKSTSE